jgi:hypothetical protein
VPADEANISPPASVAEEKQPVAPVSQKAGKAQRSVSTIADQFKSQTTLHESYHQRYAGEGDTLSQASMVTSLQAAIGVNDRFTFIRELFMNNEAAYNNAVGILNDAPSFNDAYNYMKQHFDWDMDSEIVQQLLNIIRRKFIKGRHE